MIVDSLKDKLKAPKQSMTGLFLFIYFFFYIYKYIYIFFVLPLFAFICFVRFFLEFASCCSLLAIKPKISLPTRHTP